MNELYKAFQNSPEGSTKHTGFFEIYTHWLEKHKDKNITLIEVGVLNGGSLFMWRSYLGKKARIIGIDLNPNAKKWENFGFEIFIGNQADSKFWEKTLKKIKSFDIFIDDGGHTNLQQITTLNQLLKFPNKNDALVFIEDTHCSYMKEFGNPSCLSLMNYIYKLSNDLSKKSLGSSNACSKIYSINIYESLLVLNLKKELSIKNKIVFNKKFKHEAKDFRHIKYSWAGKLIKVKFIKTLFKYLYYKIDNLKCTKYF